MDFAIKVENLSKEFLIPHEKRTTLKEHFVGLFNKISYEKFYALKKISFEIKKGEFIGIIGKNGSGKSTLLKLLAGIYTSTKGRLVINGDISPFLELGVGFNPELSGRENVYLNASVLGLSKKEINERYDAIVEFAELERFMDMKLKNYSSGMFVRLAFAVAIQVNAPIILMDEVLAVGDNAFQEKCFAVFKRLKREGKTIILVSHSMSNIEEFADRVILIDKGELLGIGSPQKMIVQYNNIIYRDEENRMTREDLKVIDDLFSTKDNQLTKPSAAKIINVEFLDEDGKAKHIFEFGRDIRCRIYFQCNEEVHKPVFGIAIHADSGEHISGPNTKTSNYKIAALKKGKGYIDYLIQKPSLLDGNYLFTAAIYDYDCQMPFDFIDRGFSFKIISAHNNKYGFIKLNEQWSIKQNA